MRFRRVIAAFLALAFAGGAPAQFEPRFNGPPRNVGTISSAQQQRAPYILAKSAIAFVHLSTGSMGNNGAITLGTALGVAYSNAYFYLPAGAVASGVPASAAWLYGTCSTVSACTVFNNAYTTGNPTVPASPTAFSTTGPGSFTGATSSEQGITITVPANALGANGALRIYTIHEYNNSAGTKSLRVRFSGSSGTQYLNVGATTTTFLERLTFIANRGVTNAQGGNAVGATSFGATTTATSVQSSVDTTAATSVFLGIDKNAATDNVAIVGFSVELLSDGT